MHKLNIPSAFTKYFLKCCLGTCKHLKEAYMKCLAKHGLKNTLCRGESLDYLKCRMNK